VLRLHAGFEVAELAIEPGSPLAGHALRDGGLTERGLVVLGVSRDDGSYLGAPSGDVVLHPSDVLTIYGRDADVRALARTA
jgi:Trk K+ transport system NAD-binding subunit